MNLHQRLEQIDARACTALAVLDGTADAPSPLEDGETPEEAAQMFLLGGYAFTPAPGSPVIAVLSVGAPDVRMIRDRDGYSLTAYSPGHAGAVLRSETITRWGRMIDEETDR